MDFSMEKVFKEGTEVNGLEINKAKVYRLKIPLNMTFAISLGNQDYYEATIVEIALEAFTGYGEAETIKEITGETPEALYYTVSGIISAMDGKRFESIEEFSNFTSNFCYGNNAAKSAVEMAMHDALAKAYDIGLYQMLGASKQARKTSLTIPIGSVKDNLQLLEKYQNMGCKIIKIKVGLDIDKDIERIKAISNNLQDGVVIFADANQGYNLSQALKVSEVLYKNEAIFFEQPLSRHDLRATRELRLKTEIPVMLDESITSPVDVIEAANAGAVDMVNVKLSKSGGISNSIKTLITAQALGLDAMVGCMLESKLGIAASLTVANAVSNVKYTDLDGFTYISKQPFEGGLDFKNCINYPIGEKGIGAYKIDGVAEFFENKK